ncbi:MAG: ATP-binding protein [Pseudomonadota bacterium]
MFGKFLANLSLNKKLVLIMLFLSFMQVSVLLFFWYQTEQDLLRAIETETKELTGAIQIGVEEITASGTTDEARLSEYLKELNAKGVREISIISNANEVVASTNPSKVGQSLTHAKRELIIKAELGQHVTSEGGTYNVILPVIAGDEQYGYLHLRVNRDSLSQPLRANAARRVGSVVVVFGLGIVITLLLSRQYTRPIETMVDAAMRVAAGDLKQSIPVRSKNEIGRLAESFNFMVAKLRENRSLEKKLRETEHLSALGQLAGNIAHEVRNPLSLISLSIDHIRDRFGPSDPESREKFGSLVSGIKQEINRLNSLVTDVLDYGRPFKLNTQKTEIMALLEDVVSLIWARVEADGISIVKEYPATPALFVDADLFKSCILNVITNSLHAMQASERGVLRLKTEVSGDKFVLSITDNGKGVPEESLPKLFEPSFSTREDGLGLGLPMTKRIVEEHGGAVEFNRLAAGSEVKLILPLYRAEPPDLNVFS